MSESDEERIARIDRDMQLMQRQIETERSDHRRQQQLRWESAASRERIEKQERERGRKHEGPLERATQRLDSRRLAPRRRRLRESRLSLYDRVIELALTVWGLGPPNLSSLRAGTWGPGAPPEVVVALVGEALARATGDARDDASWVVAIPIGQQEAIEDRVSEALATMAERDGYGRGSIAELPRAAEVMQRAFVEPPGSDEPAAWSQADKEVSRRSPFFWLALVKLFAKAVPGRSRRLRVYWAGLALALGLWSAEPAEWLDEERRRRARSVIEFAGETLSSRSGRGLREAESLVARELEEARSERFAVSR